MVRIGFCVGEKLILERISTKMNSEAYCNMLEKPLLLFLDDNEEKKYIFQQDNAPCHRVSNTKKWFLEHNIECMEWPALSPDLNPVENLWSDISRIVYANGKQYNKTQDLDSAILSDWSSISSEKLKGYVKGMQKRMIDLIKSKGDRINK